MHDRSLADAGLTRREMVAYCAEGDVGVELIIVSAAYIGVMAAVFTKGVARAARTHRDAQPD